MRMTETRTTEEGLDGLIQQTFRLFELIPYSLLALGARFAVGLFFFRSALTRVGEKIDLGFMSIPLPWAIADNQDFVFAEYKYFGFEMPEWFHAITMHPIVWAESIAPLFLMVGLASRYAAFVLCVMALVIGLVVYPNFFSKETLAMAVLAAIIFKGGPGLISLDAPLRRMRWPNN